MLLGNVASCSRLATTLAKGFRQAGPWMPLPAGFRLVSAAPYRDAEAGRVDARDCWAG